MKPKAVGPFVAPGNMILPFMSSRHRSNQEVTGSVICLVSTIRSTTSSIPATPKPSEGMMSFDSPWPFGRSERLIFASNPARNARTDQARETMTTSNGGSLFCVCNLAKAVCDTSIS